MAKLSCMLPASVEDVLRLSPEELLIAECRQCAECLDDIQDGDAGGRLTVAGGVIRELYCRGCWPGIRRRLEIARGQ